MAGGREDRDQENILLCRPLSCLIGSDVDLLLFFMRQGFSCQMSFGQVPLKFIVYLVGTRLLQNLIITYLRPAVCTT